MNGFNFKIQFPLAVGIVLIAASPLALRCLGQSEDTLDQPTEREVRKYFEERIKSESDGRISMYSVSIKAGPIEGRGKIAACSVYYFAQVWFNAPCIWDTRANGSTLSFTTTDLQRSSTNKLNTLEVSRRGQGYFFSGYLDFERKGASWSPTELKVRFYPKQGERQDFGRISCVSNLQGIANALRAWAMEHENSYAFNLSTNAGGTKELCAIGVGGFDQQPEIHFRAMASRLLDRRYLICAADFREAAAQIALLQETNVSYQLRTDSSVTLNNPNEILCQCPIHSVAICCNGRIKYLKPPLR